MSPRITAHRQHVASLLARAGLLGLADSALFARERLRTRRSNHEFTRENNYFPVPPLDLCFDAYNHTSFHEYRAVGARHARLVHSLIEAYAPPAPSPNRAPLDVLEWGCGPGRVIRHLPALFGAPDVRLVGSDYNPRSIDWCRRELPLVTFLTNTLAPPLPFPAGSFDCIYALSVFTHLSERSHHLWLAELRRVLRPNGLLILTTHGDTCAACRLTHDELDRYIRGDLVERPRWKEGKKNFASYQSPRFVREHLLAGMDVLAHLPGPSGGMEQDVWVARRSPGGASG